MVIAPHLYLVTDTAASNLNAYVQNGGTLLMNYFSGIVDENEHIRLGGYPASFRDMLGLVIEEFVPYPAGIKNSIKTVAGERFINTFWADVIHLTGAQALAEFEQDYYAGFPAITYNRFGKGSAYYLGTELEPAGLDWLLGRILEQTGIQPVLPALPTGVEVMLRSNESKEWLFILNHTGSSVEIAIDKKGLDLISGLEVKDSIQLTSNEVAVIEREKT
jgi:beta-galactosidase